MSSLDIASYPDTGPTPATAPAGPRALLAGALGNALEWYDFAAYGFLAAIFAKNFFPDSDAFVGLIAAFGIFAASFIMRPVGGIVFGHIGDRYGRRQALFISAATMTASTVAIGLLPTYAAIGAAAPALLLVLRLLQGLSIGGEYTTSAIFLAENAKVRRRGLIASFAGCGASGGTLLGSAVGAATATLMSTDDLIAWGWRIPFLLGILLGGFTLYLRGSSQERAAPARPHRVGRLPLVEALRADGREMIRAAVLNLTLGVSFYMLFVYLTTYMQQVDGLTERLSLQINTISMVVVLGLAPVFAALSDRVGRKPVVCGGLIGFVLFSWPLFLLLDSGDAFYALAGQLGFAVLMAAYAGPMPCVLVEMFRPATRCTALSLSYNLALGLAGGTAPMVAVYLVNREQFDMGPAAYLIVVAALSLIAALTMKEGRGRALS
ncbi:MFS transporter [Ancylobacter vacuolatus]|uniref:MHS family proline/betaine transporter-like MFS transporter n=1 Tax=Ancylobacter vacuolatus TaxID=223389 RepID=A0ABU0DES7_9HYPH|nr:MFS transporter [Ancylobacter vacuolatus]MDQ0346920.1 MHS family proline/betaine transporter-like MFS transporter [Ancylobacter vacuolatus]